MKLFCRFLSVFCITSFAVPAFAAELLDEKPRIAVMSAFEPEWKALLSQISDSQNHVVNGRRYVTGRLAGKDVVLFLSGVSMVNAAMTTQQAIDHFNMTTVVVSGIAGGVDPSLSIGDVVVSDQWGQYLEAIYARKTNGSFAIPSFLDTEFPNFGMIFPTRARFCGMDSPNPRIASGSPWMASSWRLRARLPPK